MSGAPRARRSPQRYQLDKRTAAIVAGSHPWVFRDHLSSAAAALADGQWLRLVDGANAVVGWGVYHAEGAIAIRVLARGPVRPGAALFAERLRAALARRQVLQQESNAFRAVHGESDGLPGVVVDVYDRWAVLQSYAAGVDGLGRWAAAWVARELGLTGVIAKPARRRLAAAPTRARRLRGAEDIPTAIAIREGARRLVVDLAGGQKSGAFLDLRGLRRWLAAQSLAGARVLNLFAYTGTLGQAAEQAGAAEIVQVDASSAALALAAAHHTGDPARHRFVVADVFAWLGAAAAARAAAAPETVEARGFDLVIIDPPSMTSRVEQVPGALASYRRLYHQSRTLLAPGGRIVAACCTSRISRAAFRNNADRVLAAVGGRLELPPEPDHPVGFAEADYLKIAIYAPR